MGAGADFADGDGDGQKEALLGTPEAFAGSLTAVGRVEAVSPATGLTLYTIWGEAANDFFGARVKAVGETSGNGVEDFLVYAEGADAPFQVNVGAWYLIEGADGSLRQKYLGAVPGGLNGPTAGLGDVDGDGVGDLALTEPFFNASAGRVTVYSGLSPATVIRQHVGSQAGWGYGIGATFSLGDADGDTVADYVISAWEWGGGTATSPGQAWLYSGATGTQIATYVGPPGTATLGAWGDRLDDVDGDGVNDLALSAPWGPLPGPAPGQPGPGQILVFSGLSGAVIQVMNLPPALVPPGGTGANFGYDVRNVGDVDGDGRNDLTFGQSVQRLLVYTRDIVELLPNPAPIGTTAVFDVSAPAQPGAAFHVLFSGTADFGVPLGTRTFPLDLDNVLLTTLLEPSLGGVLDASGNGAVSVAVPPNPALSGASLVYTAITLSPASPLGVKTIGNARPLAIQ